RGLALARYRTRCDTVSSCNRTISAGLSRAFDLELPLHYSSGAHDLAGGLGTRHSGLHADGYAGDAADHSRLHDFRLLDLRRQAARGRRLSLSLMLSLARGVR